MDAGDRRLFEESLRHATERHTGAALDAALADLGWLDALDADPRVAAGALFELHGAANVTSSALDDVLAVRLGVDPASTAVVLPRLGSCRPPGELAGQQLAVHGLATAGLPRRASAVVVTAAGAFIVPSAGIPCRAVGGLDPALQLSEIITSVPLSAAQPLDGVQWPSVLAAGQLALAHELVGCALTMLRLAREHAIDRVQFDRPIAGFQAVRHRLAESLVAIEGAQAAVAAAEDDASPFAASLAKAIAGSSARTVARHAQQVLGGIGYTTDHAHHRYVRRVLVLDQLLGAGRTLTREIGQQLIRARQLPGMLPL